jgi:hypothetical protein
MRKLHIVSLFASLAILLFPAAALAEQVTFNSQSNSPTYGGSNERYFFRAKNADSSSGGFTNGTVTVDSGNAVLMQAYINNNTSSTISNVKLTITLPTASSTSQAVTAVISASNSNPASISDTVTFAGSTPFTLAFDSNASVNITRGSTITSSNASISGNILTVDLGNLAGPNDRVLVTARALVNHQNNQTTTSTTTTPSTTTTSTPQVVLACGTLTLGSDNRTLTLTNPTTTNATLSSYTFTTRNSAGNTVNTVTNPANAQNSNVYTFTQTAPDTYTVSAVVNTDKGSTATNACTHQFIVQAPVTLSASTTQPTSTTKLPNTGAGDTIAIFVTAITIASGGHYILFRRKF